MTKSTTSTANDEPTRAETTQTSAGKVSLVMHKAQRVASRVEVGEYTFEKDAEPVEVPAKDAEKLLERRDERGWPYVAKA
jgi:hypothetical protein